MRLLGFPDASRALEAEKNDTKREAIRPMGPTAPHFALICSAAGGAHESGGLNLYISTADLGTTIRHSDMTRTRPARPVPACRNAFDSLLLLPATRTANSRLHAPCNLVRRQFSASWNPSAADMPTAAAVAEHTHTSPASQNFYTESV